MTQIKIYNKEYQLGTVNLVVGRYYAKELIIREIGSKLNPELTPAVVSNFDISSFIPNNNLGYGALFAKSVLGNLKNGQIFKDGVVLGLLHPKEAEKFIELCYSVGSQNDGKVILECNNPYIVDLVKEENIIPLAVVERIWPFPSSFY